MTPRPRPRPSSTSSPPSQAAEAQTVAGKLAAEKARLASMQAEQARLKKILEQRAAEAKRRAEAARRGRRRAKKPAGAAVEQRRGGGGGGGAPPNGYLSRPSTGCVSSEFGMRFHPIHQYWRLHSGRDYAAPCGSPVKAAASGTVIMAGDGGGYGNRVVIDHGLESATASPRPTTTSSRSGSGAAGSAVARSSATRAPPGRSTGCHLHFETLEDGDFVDPRRWL